MSVQYGTSTGHYRTGMTSMSAPLTLSFWAKINSVTTTAGVAMMISGGTWVLYWIIYDSSTAQWFFSGRNGGSEARAYQTGTITTTDWVHVAGVAASATSRTIYVNGVAGTANTTSLNPSCTSMSLGFRTDGAIPSSGGSYFAGQVEDAAIWTSALSAAQIASLAAGASPLVVDRANLRSYVPLRSGSVIDLRGGSLTAYGSPTVGVDKPRLYLP